MDMICILKFWSVEKVFEALSQVAHLRKLLSDVLQMDDRDVSLHLSVVEKSYSLSLHLSSYDFVFNAVLDKNFILTRIGGVVFRV